jgi:hypothetical protein
MQSFLTELLCMAKPHNNRLRTLANQTYNELTTQVRDFDRQIEQLTSRRASVASELEAVTRARDALGTLNTSASTNKTIQPSQRSRRPATKQKAGTRTPRPKTPNTLPTPAQLMKMKPAQRGAFLRPRDPEKNNTYANRSHPKYDELQAARYRELGLTAEHLKKLGRD